MSKIFSLFIMFASLSSFASFEDWKKQYAKRAAKRGIPSSFTLDILKDVKFDSEVIEKDKNQVILSEKKDYLVFIKKWLRESPSRIELGKEMLKKHKDLLNKVEKKYGVEKEVIVSLWGVETLYGKITGDYDLIRSLSSLSYDGRRRKFFETQLNALLRALKQGHVKRDQLKGSWAGATGQCQFMPSNIPVYAQDFDGDGRKDIWGTTADVFASIAYLLKKAGWQKGKTIGSLALNPKNIEIEADKYRSRKAYENLGFTSLSGGRLTGYWTKRRFAYIPMKNSPIVLRGTNYKPLLKWNNSSLFAAFNILLIEGFSK